MKFLNKFELSPGRAKGEHISGPSITQPDEALSIQEILYRVSHGQTTGIGASTNDDDYDDPDDEDFDDPTLQPGFDKLDALEYATSEQSEDLRNKVEDHKKRVKQKQQDDLFDQEVERRIAERDKANKPSENPNS